MVIKIVKPGKLRNKLFNKNHTKKPSLTPDEMKGVMRQFDFKSWEFCTSLDGGSSDNFLIQTSQGKKVLKRYYWSLPSTIYEHSIHRFIFSKNFPCARIALNINSQSYSKFDDKYYALYDFVEGYCCSDYFIPPNFRQRLIALAAGKLADFHRLITGFVPRGRKLNGFRPDGVYLWRDCKWHLSVVDQYLNECYQEDSQKDDTFSLPEIADELKQLFVESDRYYQQPDPPLPKLVNHGDYQPKNVLFDPNGLSGVLDFGDANLNFRIADLARALKTFCKDRLHFLNIKQVQVFLDAYQDRNALSEKELLAIPDLMLRRNLGNIIWALHGELHQHECRRTPKYRMQKMQIKWEEALWIKENKSKLQYLFLSVGKR
jgi:Ser/Thr protein kinase RdoA (MazF antagonist)